MATSILAHPCATPNSQTGDATRPPRQLYQRYDLTVDAEALDGALRLGIVPEVLLEAEPLELALGEVL